MKYNHISCVFNLRGFFFGKRRIRDRARKSNAVRKFQADSADNVERNLGSSQRKTF